MYTFCSPILNIGKMLHCLATRSEAGCLAVNQIEKSNDADPRKYAHSPSPQAKGEFSYSGAWCREDKLWRQEQYLHLVKYEQMFHYNSKLAILAVDWRRLKRCCIAGGGRTYGMAHTACGLQRILRICRAAAKAGFGGAASPDMGEHIRISQLARDIYERFSD